MRRLLRYVVVGTFLAGHGLSAQNLAVTSVEGESWLQHLARNFDETSMGKTGRLGPPTAVRLDESSRSTPELLSITATQTVAVRGADLYRLNCRGCHGESGIGAPPEINSVINPVRSTSVALIIERMKNVGMDANPATAAKMAKQSRNSLLLRLHQGGHDMPPFHQLHEPEIRALMGYLRQLAGVSGAGSDHLSLQESRLRVGEQIAKSTCHICHAASGPNPDAQQIMDGSIPPLATLTTREDLSEFVRKVTQGAPVIMGTPPLLCRGRMPVFGYLSKNEAEDVYLYLALYPPRSWEVATASLTASGFTPSGGGSSRPNTYSPKSAGRGDPPPVSLWRFSLFPAALFLFLGGVVIRYLPLAARLQPDHEMGVGDVAVDESDRIVVAESRV